MKVEAGQGAEELANDLEEGARLLDRVADEADAERPRARSPAAAAALRDTVPGADRPDRARRWPPGCSSTCTSTRCASWSPRPPSTRSGSTGRGALYGSWYEFFPRSEGPVVGGKPTARHVRQRARTGCRRSPRWASTSSTCRRSTRSARSTARARTRHSSRRQPARDRSGRRRLAVGDRQRRGRPRRRPPAAGHDGRLHGLRRPHPRAGHGGGAGLRAAGRAGPPVGRRAPGVVHHQARRHDRLRGEPAEEVPGHLPDQLRQRPRGHLRRVPAGDPGLDRGRA